jgi:uncharacterized membrane protein
MSQDKPEFNRGVIRPVECLKEGWALIKEQYGLFIGITFVGILVGSAFAILLMGPMYCGIFLCLFRRMRGEEVGLDRLFKGFDYFAPSVVATLIQTIPAFVVGIPAFLLLIVGVAFAAPEVDQGSETATAAFVLGIVVFSLLLALVYMTISLFFYFAFPLIVDRGLSGVDAVKASARAALANFGGLLGLVLLSAALSFVGVLLCYVGWILVLPVIFAAHAVAYRRVFPEGKAQPVEAPA